MIAILIRLIGFTLALLPLKALEFLVESLAELFILLPTVRRRVLLSNLRYAYPNYSHSKIKLIAKDSTARMLEMGFFSLCYIYLSKEQRRRSILYSKESENELRKLRESKEPVLFLTPHTCLFETLATSPFFKPSYPRKLGAIYRPHRNSVIDRRVNQGRQAMGLETFSRKEGLWKAKKHLSSGNWLILLFDQNAGDQGALSLFLGRVASITMLPDLLQKSTNAITIYACPKRIGFFQSRLEIIKLDNSRSVALNCHNILASDLIKKPKFSPEWLWSHGKWKTKFYPKAKFNLDSKRNVLPDIITRKLVFLLRMPNWLGDVIMAIPIVIALRKARRDVKIVLLCKPQFKELLELFNICDEIICLENVFSISGIKKFLAMRYHYPECHLLFTNSFRGDFEAFLIGAIHKFGLEFPWRKRPLLTHSYEFQGNKSDLKNIHQVKVWEKMCISFGLQTANSYDPLYSNDKSPEFKIAIIIGSSNNPQKCWALHNWIRVCEEILKHNSNALILIFGTTKDRADAEKLATVLPDQQVSNFAGETTLANFAKELRTCKIAIGCDSGGVHLANALGVETYVLFGPTNPVVTSPCFDSPVHIIMPKNSDITGGQSIDLLTPEEVFKKIKKGLNPFETIKHS